MEWEGVTSSSAGTLLQKGKDPKQLTKHFLTGVQKAEGTVLELNPDATYSSDNNL